MPFSRDRAGTKWTPDDVKDTRMFGYTYPEIQSGKREDTVAAVNRLYGAAYNANKPLRRRDVTTGAVTVAAAPPAAAAGFEVEGGGRQRHYIANLISNKHALNGSYAIYVFVGEFDEQDPCSWPISPNLAGTHVAFSGLHRDTGLVRPSVMMGGVVPLTNILIHKVMSGDLASMDEESVEDYLEKNLHWRAAKVRRISPSFEKRKISKMWTH
jgi:tyrosinase